MSGDQFKPHGRGLPPLASWRHHPLLFRVNPDVPKACEGGYNIPLNPSLPTAFETPLFVGEVLFRIRNVRDGQEDAWADEAKYAGKKRLMVLVVQGKFKKRLSFGDVKSGFECQRPLQVGWLAKPALSACLTACKYVQPGLEANVVNSPQPYVRNYLASSCDTFTITPPGDTVPPITGGEPPENGPWPDKKARRNALKLESSRKEKYYEPANTYTFGFHSDKMMFLDFKAKLPLGRDLDMSQYLNGQPFPFLSKTLDGEFLWKFELWHEALLSKTPKEMWDTTLGHRGLELSMKERNMGARKSLAEQGLGLPKRASSYRLRKDTFGADALSEESESDEDVKELRYRLQDLHNEQNHLCQQMDSMVRNGDKAFSTTPAHKEFSASVAAAITSATLTLKSSNSKPFDEAESYHFLKEVQTYLSSH